MDETPKPYRGRPVKAERAMPRIDVLVTPELRHRVRMAAGRADMRLGEWVKSAIEEKLARDEG